MPMAEFGFLFVIEFFVPYSAKHAGKGLLYMQPLQTTWNECTK